ncbi:uncharacterized protein LOC111340621 [Stylophora pistillata]|uniref:uncharacterized protein LOC111340621 n=1 Tax=Stylophora pistillata TaxID=50429 RepID=UPI000C03F732|nr:uncharacterized protein LOC111340621 [Stylophora pistillata]XP_022803232.1 uncharacterized protein LOC111340621 [Stylophora pistillata]
MQVLIIVILQLLLLLTWSNPTRGQCGNEDWTSTFAIAGDSTSQCANNVYYVNGLRSEGYGALLETGPGVIKAARCCSVDQPYSQESNNCYQAQWWTDLQRHDSWALCENPGYLLRGFFTVGRNFLADIGEGVCCKPVSHPDQDGPCRDITVNFIADGMKRCPNGMFLKGLYKTRCSTIDCLTQIRCCELIPGRVDGGWSNWGAWNPCPVTCGGANQIRFRMCTNPTPSNGGNNCVGVPLELQTCNSTPC